MIPRTNEVNKAFTLMVGIRTLCARHKDGTKSVNI